MEIICNITLHDKIDVVMIKKNCRGSPFNSILPLVSSEFYGKWKDLQEVFT